MWLISTLVFHTGAQTNSASATALLEFVPILAIILSTVKPELRNTSKLLLEISPYDSSIAYSEYMQIEYVTVPVQTHTARLEIYVEKFEDNHKIGAFRHKEYESIIQHRTLNKEGSWAEWP